MVSRSMRLAAMTVLTLAAAAAAPAALAQSSVQEVVVYSGTADNPNAESRKKTVSYADLDVAADAGAKVLLQRIQSAAKVVCAPEPATLADRPAYKACYDRAVSHALTRLGNAKVSALAASGG